MVRFLIEKEIATAARRSGQHAEANAAEARMREIAAWMVRDLASQPEARDRWAWWAVELGNLLRDVRPDEARSLLQQACELQTPTNPDPVDPELTRIAARAYYILAGMDDRVDRVAEAARGFEKAAALFEQLSARDPRDSAFIGYLAISYHVLGRIHVDGGRPQQALALFQKSVSFRERLCRIDPEDSIRLSDCAGTWYRLGEALLLVGRHAEAIEAACKSLTYLRQMSPRDLGETEYRRLWTQQTNRLFWLLLAASPRPS
jgi:tetratricopeptide (TPR) repeat protein